MLINRNLKKKLLVIPRENNSGFAKFRLFLGPGDNCFLM